MPFRGEVLALHALAAVRLARGGDAAAADAALREAQRLYQEMGAPLRVERLAQQIG